MQRLFPKDIKYKVSVISDNQATTADRKHRCGLMTRITVQMIMAVK